MDETMSSDELYEIEEELFYFESDHVALRGNTDYSALLRTLAVLEAQRTQVAKDLDTLAQAKAEALADPELFIRKLQNNEPLNIPSSVNVIDLPHIDFERYGVKVPDLSSATGATVQDLKSRVIEESQTKQPSYNKLWSCEEQRRLEELLIEYPPEAVESRRFAKIAKALGNRTSQQVASRLQKYFLKLHLAGMPIPGRIPKSSVRNAYNHKAIRFNRNQVRPSTFFPATDVPVTMPEDDDFSGIPQNSGIYMGATGSSFDVSARNNTKHKCIVVDDESDNEEETSASTRKIKLLQRIKADKELDLRQTRPYSEHIEFKCDLCNSEPIVGTRWHCKSCTHTTIDFCTDCLVDVVISPEQSEHLFHQFCGYRMVRNNCESTVTTTTSEYQDDDNTSDSNPNDSTSIQDKDYLPEKFTAKHDGITYNYLDPNFMSN